MAEHGAAQLTRVSGNLPGDQKNYYLGTDVDTSRGRTTAASKFKVDHMSYPIDVDSDPMVPRKYFPTKVWVMDFTEEMIEYLKKFGINIVMQDKKKRRFDEPLLGREPQGLLA